MANVSLEVGEAIQSIAENSLAILGAVFGDSLLAGEGGGLLVPSNLAGDIKSTLVGKKRHAVDLARVESPMPISRQPMASNMIYSPLTRSNPLPKTAQWGDALAVAGLGLAVAGAAANFIALGLSIADRDIAAEIVGSIIAQGIAIVANAIGVASLVVMMVAAGAAKMLKSMIKAIEISAGVVIFFAVSVGISVGFFIYQVIASAIEFGSLAFNQLLAGLIASIIVAVILFAIGLIPGVGQLVVAIIALIDAIVTFVCMIAKPDGSKEDAEFRDYVCGGISGLLTKFVEWTIYDQTPAIELDRTDRLNLTNFEFDLSVPALGFVAGNSMEPAVEVEARSLSTMLMMPRNGLPLPLSAAIHR